MNIRCDVCETAAASVFCTADEAALCDTCDCRVHHANKLASKHQRLSLFVPSSKESPTCDICQGKRAFLFCQEDRALLCRDCDISIHSANEHTKKHNRFLLTGVKVSATSSIYTSSSSSSASSANLINCQESSVVPGFNSQPLMKKHISDAQKNSDPPSVAMASSDKNLKMVNKSGFDNLLSSEGAGFPTGDISEYPIELISLPGWHIEDFLDSSSFPLGFSKDHHSAPSVMDETHIYRSNAGSFASENLGIWVPQASINPLHLQTRYQFHVAGQKRFRETTKEASLNASNAKSGDKTWIDDAFTVPHIGSKRSRPFS